VLDEIDKAICIIKETRAGGEYFRPGEVCEIVRDKLKGTKEADWKYSPSYHHVKCTRYFKIKEERVA